MKAKEGILDHLGTILTAELTAVHQYLLHAELCRHWGYERLAEKFQHLYTEEVTHSGHWSITSCIWAVSRMSGRWMTVRAAGR